MSALEVFKPAESLEEAVQRDLDAISQKRFVSTFEASLIAGCHLETVRDALREGTLHGSQRMKGGTWKLRPACVEAWVDGMPCEHQEETKRPVSLADWRARPVGSRS
ncbi:hypothetical protein [Leucobacter sp.]